MSALDDGFSKTYSDCRCGDGLNAAQETADIALADAYTSTPLLNTSNPKFVECLPKTFPDLLGKHEHASFDAYMSECMADLPANFTKSTWDPEAATQGSNSTGGIAMGPATDDVSGSPVVFVERDGNDADENTTETESETDQFIKPPETPLPALRPLTADRSPSSSGISKTVTGIIIGAVGAFPFLLFWVVFIPSFQCCAQLCCNISCLA